MNETEKRTQYINSRLYERNIPSNSLQPYLSTIPINTKYMKYDAQNINKNNSCCNYNPEKHFGGGDRKMPCWSDYVDIETILRNQHIPLTKCPKEKPSFLQTDTRNCLDNKLDYTNSIYQQQKFLPITNMLFNKPSRNIY